MTMNKPRRALRVCVALVLGGAALAASGCGKKAAEPANPPPEITGLAAVPATAEAVVGADVARLAGAPVIDRAVEQLLLRDQVLAERWGRLKDDCKIDLVKQVKRVMLAIGPHAGTKPGTGPVLMVVIGSIPESDLKECVAKLVGGGSGAITGKAAYGRTLYLAKEGSRAMYFAYGRPDTIVLGSSEEFVTEALSTGAKAADNAELAKWLRMVDQNSSLWAVGRIDARVRDGLVQLADGKLGGGPVALAATAELSDGARLQLAVVMPSADDAAKLESYAKGELALLTAAAQWKSLGSVVGKVAVTADKEIVHLRVPFSVEDLNLLLSALDGGGTPAQDSRPSAVPGSDSGSGSGARQGSGSGPT
jgi:hypothetical protein